MKKYVVTVRMNDGTTEFFECEATSPFDAKQQAGWAYIREGVAQIPYEPLFD